MLLMIVFVVRQRNFFIRTHPPMEHTTHSQCPFGMFIHLACLFTVNKHAKRVAVGPPDPGRARLCSLSTVASPRGPHLFAQLAQEGTDGAHVLC